jgi:UDP-N-acetylglucosamine 4,6-dehydratase
MGKSPLKSMNTISALGKLKNYLKSNPMKNKTVAITGAAGYLGRALIERLVGMNPKEIRCYDHNEEKAVWASKLFPTTKWMVGDISDPLKMYALTHKTDVVFHLAAAKHIPVCEENPALAVDVNILGTVNVARQAISNKVKEVIGISTDKACQPQTVYGMSKYFMERLFAQYNKMDLDTKFYTVRYGNVAASSGSVFEIWNKRGQEGKVLEITVPDMTRFYWTVEESVDFIFEGLKKKDEDKPAIPKMKAMRMGDVAEVFSEHYGVGIKEVGNRGNEKIHEDLDEGITSDKVEKFTSEEIKSFLKKLGLL